MKDLNKKRETVNMTRTVRKETRGKYRDKEIDSNKGLGQDIDKDASKGTLGQRKIKDDQERDRDS